MLPQEIIRHKRDGDILPDEEIHNFIKGITDESVSEAQIAAFCMATLLKGMNTQERAALTTAMTRSGTVIDWAASGLDGPVLDKHSTGGVGDKISLMLAPMIAACGGYVPMISGRGLGHTGGTLDKMDSIPGYVSQPDLATLKKVVKDTGSAIIGATADIAPADRRIYAVRDVTATVESIDLITASILSKKCAAGLDGLVMDVKCGNGAFMQDHEKAQALARTLVEVANQAGLPCCALITDMNQVLGRSAGNAVEVREAVAFLRGENSDKRLYEITIALCGALLALGGLAGSAAEGEKRAAENLASGRAAEYFSRSVAALGGPADLVENPGKYLPPAPLQHAIHAPQPGIIKGIDTRALGLAVIELGGGRRQTSDPVDHSVGLTDIAAPGEAAGPDAPPLAVICGTDEDKVAQAEQIIHKAFTIAPPGTAVEAPPVIAARIDN